MKFLLYAKGSMPVTAGEFHFFPVFQHPFWRANALAREPSVRGRASTSSSSAGHRCPLLRCRAGVISPGLAEKKTAVCYRAFSSKSSDSVLEGNREVLKIRVPNSQMERLLPIGEIFHTARLDSASRRALWVIKQNKKTCADDNHEEK